MSTFSLRDAEGVSQSELAQINISIAEHIRWFEEVIGRWNTTIGFIIELAQHEVGRNYNTHSILDEIAILEGRSNRKSLTKRAARFLRPPLTGLWHKHHFQARFMLRNVVDEVNRAGDLERRLSPDFGKILGDVLGEVRSEIVDGSYIQRAKRRRLTGEFIVFDKCADGTNLYLTLGRHGEYEAIAKRVLDYETFDFTHGHRHRS